MFIRTSFLGSSVFSLLISLSSNIYILVYFITVIERALLVFLCMDTVEWDYRLMMREEPAFRTLVLV